MRAIPILCLLLLACAPMEREKGEIQTNIRWQEGDPAITIWIDGVPHCIGCGDIYGIKFYDKVGRPAWIVYRPSVGDSIWMATIKDGRSTKFQSGPVWRAGERADYD